MNASRVKGLLLAALFSGLLVTQAAAQSGPVRLVPPTQRPQVQPPQPDPVPERGKIGADGVTMEAPTDSTNLPGALPTDAPVLGGTVRAESLGAVNPDVAGALTEDAGGFGDAMWLGTERRVIETLLPQLPVTTSSPAMRDLMKRLLLTGAAVPAGGEPGSLLSLRTGLLAAMGDFIGVNALLDVVPGYAENADLLRVEVDTRLLTGDVARACQMAHAHIETQKTVYWQKLFIFCQALEGQQEAVLLGLGLLEELGVDDPVYFQLVDAIVGGVKSSAVSSLADPTPLHLAVARVASAQLPGDVISSNRPGVLRAIAISPNAAPELRLEAAERAEAAGALPVDALRQLYASIRFSEDELKNPLTVAAQRSGPMSRALLYRATLQQTVPAAQAEALSRALELARSGGRYASAARAFLPQLSRVSPTTDLAWFAPEAIRAFLITGRHQAARPWFQLLAQVAVREPKMEAERIALMPVARLSNYTSGEEGEAIWSVNELPRWWAVIKDQEGARDKAATLAAVFSALGEDVPDAMWMQLIDGPSHQSLLAPHPALWFLVEGAANKGRRGEAVLSSLVILGDGGPARADPMVLYRVLMALRALGLHDSAQAMGVEAVVAAGL